MSNTVGALARIYCGAERRNHRKGLRLTVTMILVLCLARSPNICRDEIAPVSVSLSECSMLGPMIGADLLAERPWLKLRGIKCQVGKRERAA